MNRFTRILCIALSVLLLGATLVGCADSGEDISKGTDTAAPGASETTCETDPVQDALDALRSDTNWKGEEFGLLYQKLTGIVEEIEAKEKADSDSSSGVINDAVYQRNTLFEEYCKLEFVPISVDYNEFGNRLMGEVQTGAGDFLLCHQTSQSATLSATSGYLYDFMELDVDYETAWWDQGPLDFALNGKVFFMNGPFDIYDDDVTFVMLFNKSLRDTYRIENPYDTVKAGKWTMDHFNELANGISAESSGNGQWDEFDTYGFATPPSVGTTLFYGANLQFIKNNRDMEAPEVMLTGSQMEKALNVLDIARVIVQDNHTTYVAPIGQEGLAKNVFAEGRSLFYCEAALYLRALNATMEAEYGILPVPKYDESQENYTTWVAGVGSCLSIPNSLGRQDLDMYAKVLETYALLSQKFVRPAYYDTMLTTRNVHDAESAEIIDDIFTHRIYDMANYFGELGFLDIFAYSVIQENTFTSDHTRAVRTFNNKIDKILSKMDK